MIELIENTDRLPVTAGKQISTNKPEQQTAYAYKINEVIVLKEINTYEHQQKKYHRSI